MVNEQSYPYIKRGLKAGIVTGLIAGVLWFLWCCRMASLPEVSDVSLSLALRPWWSNWKSALVVFAFFFVLVGALAALRPKPVTDNSDSL